MSFRQELKDYMLRCWLNTRRLQPRSCRKATCDCLSFKDSRKWFRSQDLYTEIIEGKSVESAIEGLRVEASERMNESGRELLDKYFEGWMKWRAFIS